MTLPSYHSTSIRRLLASKPDSVIGAIATNSDFTVLPSQRDAWLAEIEFLKSCLAGLDGAIFFEFSIPRMGRRIDVVLVIGPVVFVVEFKVGESRFARGAVEQVWDYALDLKNFHEASHNVAIVPILLATEAKRSPDIELIVDEDKVFRPICVHPDAFREALELALERVKGEPIDAERWARAPYRPTPTILEAARALYAQHSVEDIARHDAGAQNLHITSQRIEDLVDEARRGKRKIICFVTGVPGAGKTLVGLNVATQRRVVDQPTHAVFLSGNGPLVMVLREALTRDEHSRQKQLGNKVRKGEIHESVKAFIQNVHHFRDEALRHPAAPADRVVIFDEAQRAWGLNHTARFMRQKKKLSGFNQSEPEFLISYMDRHDDWAVIICLVGGGQDINTGEAGIEPWLDAVETAFPDWHMHISSQLADSEYAAERALAIARKRPNAHFDDALHLAVSMRSFRAENVSAFVKALIDCEEGRAREVLQQIGDRFPIVVTRNLGAAKLWIRDHARGSERYGLLASSRAQRLKPDAIDIRYLVNPIHWFLNGRDDTRSSFYFEDAATQYRVQGLELDWALVAWDADLRFSGEDWSHHRFRGDKWVNVHKADDQRYLRNAYRVLLTRARQGMAIYVPPGDPADSTRAPRYYDATFRFLRSAGLREIA